MDAVAGRTLCGGQEIAMAKQGKTKRHGERTVLPRSVGRMSSLDAIGAE